MQDDDAALLVDEEASRRAQRLRHHRTGPGASETLTDRRVGVPELGGPAVEVGHVALDALAAAGRELALEALGHGHALQRPALAEQVAGPAAALATTEVRELGRPHGRPRHQHQRERRAPGRQQSSHLNPLLP